MGIKTRIFGGRWGTEPEITKRGQLVTGALEFEQFHLGSTIANNVAVNVIEPVSTKCFIITAIILSGNRDIGVNGAITDVFENTTGPTSAIVNREILQEEISKQTRMTATGLNIIVSAGSWVNVKSDDVIVRCNIAGYYVDDV